MDLTFLSDYVVVMVVGICLCVGYIIKNATSITNKYIPLIMGVLGVILNTWLNDWSFTPVILLGGLFSGLASTGLYEAFRNIIERKGDTDED